MNRLKQTFFTGSFKSHLLWLIPLLFLGVITFSLTSVFQSHADKADAPGQVKKEGQAEEKKEKKKPQKKRLANVTIEREGYFIKNADTPHAFMALKKRLKGEKAPNLSRSKIEAEVLKSGAIRYTVTLKNKGNIKASDIDMFNEMDPRLGQPSNIKFKSCGKKHRQEIGEGFIEFANITVQKNKNCVIKYDVTPNSKGAMANRFYLSPAAEGGEEIGPIESTAVRIRQLPGSQDEAEPVTEEEAGSADTEESEDDTVETRRGASQKNEEALEEEPGDSEPDLPAGQAGSELTTEEPSDAAESSGDAEENDVTTETSEEELTKNEEPAEEVPESASEEVFLKPVEESL